MEDALCSSVYSNNTTARMASPQPEAPHAHAHSEDATSAGIGELINELQILLSEAKHGSHEVVPVGGTRWRGSMQRQTSTRCSPEQASSAEVAELQFALQQSGGALRASQQHLQALSARVEELQVLLETECESMVALVQEELLAAHMQHERTVKALQDRLRRQQAAADEAARAASVRHAALEEQLHMAAGPGRGQEELQLRLQAQEGCLAELQAELLPSGLRPSAPPAAAAESDARPISAADMAALVQAVRGLKPDSARGRADAGAAAAWRTCSEPAKAAAASHTAVASALCESFAAAAAASAAGANRGLGEDLHKWQAQALELQAGSTGLSGHVASLSAEAAALAASNSALQAELLGAAERQAGLAAEVAELRAELRRGGWKQALAPQQKSASQQGADGEAQLPGAAGAPQEQPTSLPEQPASQGPSEAQLHLAAGIARLQAAVTDTQLAEAQHRQRACEATDLAVATLEALAAAEGSSALLRAEAAQLRVQAADLGEQLGQARGRARAEGARLAEVCSSLAALRAQRAKDVAADRAWWAAVQARAAVRELCGRAFRAVERAAAGEHARCLAGGLDAAAARTLAAEAEAEAATGAAARARERAQGLEAALAAARCELAEAGCELEELRDALARAGGELAKLQGRGVHLEAALAAEGAGRAVAEAAAASLRDLMAAAEAASSAAQERLESALAGSRQQLLASSGVAAAARAELVAQADAATAARGELQLQLAALGAAGAAARAERASLAEQLALERSQHAACAARAITARALLAAERSAAAAGEVARAEAGGAGSGGGCAAAAACPPACAAPEAVRMTTVVWDLGSPAGSMSEGAWPHAAPGAATPRAGRPAPHNPKQTPSSGPGTPASQAGAAHPAADHAAPAATAAAAGGEPLRVKDAACVPRSGEPGSGGLAASVSASASLSAFQGAQLEATIAALEAELATARAALQGQQPPTVAAAAKVPAASAACAAEAGRNGLSAGAPGGREGAAGAAEVRVVTLRVLRAVERDEAARQLHAEREARAACAARAAAARTVYDDAHWRLAAALASYARLVGETDALRGTHAELAAEVGHARRAAEQLRLQVERLKAEQAAAQQAAAQQAAAAVARVAAGGGVWVAAAGDLASAQTPGTQRAELGPPCGAGGAGAPAELKTAGTREAALAQPVMLSPGRRLVAGPAPSAEPCVATPATRDVASVSARGGVQGLAAHEGGASRDSLPDLGGLCFAPHAQQQAAPQGEEAEALRAAGARGASVGQLEGESGGWRWERAKQPAGGQVDGSGAPTARRRSASWTNLRLYDNPMFCGELQPEAEGGGAAVRASAGSATAGARPLDAAQQQRPVWPGSGSGRAADQLVAVSKGNSVVRLCRRMSRTFGQHD